MHSIESSSTSLVSEDPTWGGEVGLTTSGESRAPQLNDGRRGAVDHTSITYEEVRSFLFLEAELLDSAKYWDWLALVSEDIEYKMPVLRTRRAADGGNEFSESSFLFDENWRSLQLRLDLLANAGTFNWVEDPRSLTRRVIGNIRLVDSESSACSVRSNFFVYRGVGGEMRYELFTGERFDRIGRRGDGGLCLCKRTIHLDQSLLLARNLSILF